MKELLLLLGGMAPIELLLEQMEEAIASARNDLSTSKELSKETKGKLGLMGTLLATRIATDGNPEKTIAMIEDFDRTQKGKDLINPSMS